MKVDTSVINKLKGLVKKTFPNAVNNGLNDQTNNVNPYMDNKSESIEQIRQLLVEHHVLPEKAVIKNLNYLPLSKSVPPHNDEGFCGSMQAKACYLIVLNQSRRFKRDDINPDGESLIWHTKGWDELYDGAVIKFNPKKDHAVICGSSLKLLCIWT